MIYVFKDQIHRMIQQKRPKHAAQCGKKIGGPEFDRLDFDFPGLHFGEIEKIVHQFQKILRRRFDVADLLRPVPRVRSPSNAVEQEPAQRQDRIQRRAELMAHVGEEFRFQLVGAPQVVGLFIQFRVERDDAAIGVFEFPVQLGKFRLPGTNLLQRGEQFVILVLQFLKRVLRPFLNECRGELA